MKKLTLSREAIRNLTVADMTAVRGGSASVRTYDLTNCPSRNCDTTYTATVNCPTQFCQSEHCTVLPA